MDNLTIAVFRNGKLVDYIKINDFYTATGEKLAAPVLRMIRTLRKQQKALFKEIGLRQIKHKK